jgi:hypothetical protein
MSDSEKELKTEPLENLDEAKEKYKNDPVFHKFTKGLIHILADKILTVEEVLTGVALAVGEYEYHIEPKQNKPS